MAISIIPTNYHSLSFKEANKLTKRANKLSKRANKLSKRANKLTKRANKLTKRANKLSKSIDWQCVTSRCIHLAGRIHLC